MRDTTVATDAQIEANRRNALKSTGPRTDEGKDVSRRNALRHGLAGVGDVLPEEDFALVEEKTAAYRASLRPVDACGEAMVAQMAVDEIRAGRCRQMFILMVNEHARRAQFCWDADRRLEAEETAAGLGRDPQRVVRRLERTLQGCELVTERWAELRRVLDDAGDWTPAQRSLALDLCGVPLTFRDGRTMVDAPEGVAAADYRRSLADTQLARLDRIRPGLAEIDAAERVAAESGLGAELTAQGRRLDRYESACNRRWHAALRHLTHARRPSLAVEIPPPPVVVETPVAPPPRPLPTIPERDVFERVASLLLAADDEPSEPATAKFTPLPAPRADVRHLNRKQRRRRERLRRESA